MSGLIALGTTPDPHRFTLAVTPRVCVGHRDHQFLFGGAGMGAAIAAVEAATGRPTVWATAQYLSFARPPATLDLDVVVPVSGRHSSQARVTGHVGDTEILTVNAALGSRPDATAMQWSAIPNVPPPDDCPAIVNDWPRHPDDINAAFEQRSARGRFGAARSMGGASPDGVSTMWVRPVAGVVDRVTLALMADFLPSGIGHAFGEGVGGNSLDNTIRFLGIVPTEWVLCDTVIEGTANGFVHGRMRLFAQGGALLATASQSMIVRRFAPPA